MLENDYFNFLNVQSVRMTSQILTSSYMSFPFTKQGVMVSVLSSSAVDHGFEPWSGQTKDYKIGICSFSAKYAALRRKSRLVRVLPLTVCHSKTLMAYFRAKFQVCRGALTSRVKQLWKIMSRRKDKSIC